MKNLSKLFLLFFSLFFGGASALFFVATLLVPRAGSTCVFSTFSGSSNFHCVFPYQYMAVCAFSAAIVIALWVYFFYHREWKQKYASLLVSLVLIAVVSSFLGGILWATHSILIEQTWRGMGVIQYFLFHIGRTFRYGWIAIARSFPYNLVLVVVGVPLIHYAARWANRFIVRR